MDTNSLTAARKAALALFTDLPLTGYHRSNLETIRDFLETLPAVLIDIDILKVENARYAKVIPPPLTFTVSSNVCMALVDTTKPCECDYCVSSRSLRQAPVMMATRSPCTCKLCTELRGE